MHGCIDSWHFMALEQKKLGQKTHLRKLSYSALWCENGFCAICSLELEERFWLWNHKGIRGYTCLVSVFFVILFTSVFTCKSTGGTDLGWTGRVLRITHGCQSIIMCGSISPSFLPWHQTRAWKSHRVFLHSPAISLFLWRTRWWLWLSWPWPVPWVWRRISQPCKSHTNTSDADMSISICRYCI